MKIKSCTWKINFVSKQCRFAFVFMVSYSPRNKWSHNQLQAVMNDMTTVFLKSLYYSDILIIKEMPKW
jgi:hypothetical protein